MKRYNNYHKHSHYSNLRSLDVIVKPNDYIKRIKELDGDKGIYFTTEHGYQGNVYESYTLCKENNLKLMVGAEVYYVDNRFEKDRSNYHLIIIALNYNGYKQLNKILSEANITGYYYKPRIDDELLFSLNPNDVIITTACVAGRLKNKDNLNEWLIKMKDYFKDNFYLEVQSHNHIVQKEHNKNVLLYSEKFNIPIIHANDSHYIYPEDAKYRDLFLQAKGIFYEEEDGFVLDYPTYDEIVNRYKEQGILNDNQIKSALDNTLVFDKYEGIEFNYDIKMPHISKDPNKELGEIIEYEFKKEIPNINKDRLNEYIDEIKKEWKVIEETNMAEYFLLNYKMVNLATTKYKGVITKTGRGSSPSFYINKLLHFTNIDRLESPVKLYPSRFMSSTRILETKSLPDIDFNVSRQQPFIDASKELLGEDNCHWMISYKPLQDSSAFRLYCKAIGMNISEYDTVAKNLDNYRDDEKWKDIIKESTHFKGVIESVAQSPCSTLLLSESISEEIGLLKVGDVICCNIDGINCDKFKYLKNDILNVLVWKLIDETCKMIGIPIPSIKELTKLLDDETYKMYELGLTCTLNQADSKFATDLFMKYKPKSIAEVSAMVAILRPGAASMLDDFINRKPYTTHIEELDDLLKDSSCRMMYQESVMTFLIWLGVDESESYSILKKIAKKKFTKEELEKLNEQLTQGWINKVGSIDGYKDMWQIVENNAKYSFNSSHSLSTGLDSLYGAYLKSHYPLEYYTVALNNYDDDTERTQRLTKELEYFNIKLANPKFRYSRSDYFMDKDTNTIYKGIASIKYLNKDVGEYLYSLRDNSYETFTDLLVDINKHINSKQLTILIKLDFFEEFGKSQKLLKVYENFSNFYGKTQINKEKYVWLNEIFEQYTTKETAKLFKFDNTLPMLKYMESVIPDEDIDIVDKVKSHLEYTGSCDVVDQTRDKQFIVLDVDVKYTPKVQLYSLSTGKTQWVKISKNVYKNNVLKLYDLIYLHEWSTKPKRKKVDDKWVKLDENEIWFDKYWKVGD